AALQSAVNDNPDVDLRLGAQFEDAVAHAKGVTVVQLSGNSRHSEVCLALIGADGIWSNVRHHLFPEVAPQFSGMIAWRGTLDATQLPREYTAPRVQLWMGPGAHLVAYPISGARRINVVAIVPGTWNRPGWSAPGDGLELKSIFGASRWPGPARTMVGRNNRPVGRCRACHAAVRGAGRRHGDRGRHSAGQGFRRRSGRDGGA